MASPRRLPPPWSVEVQPNYYIVRDANKQQLAYVYFENEPGRRSAAKLLTKDEARWRPARENGNHSMIWIKNNVSCDAFNLARLGECRRFESTHMTLKTTLTIVTALLAGGTSLAMAQNGPPTGGQSPVAGGANGGSWGGGWYGGGWYGGAPVYGYGYSYGYAPYRPLYGYYGPYWRRHWRY